MAKNNRGKSSFLLLLTAIFSTPTVAADAIQAACIDIVSGAIDDFTCSDDPENGYSKPATSLNTQTSDPTAVGNTGGVTSITGKSTTISSPTTITGTTQINTTGTAATSIGNASSTGTITGQSLNLSSTQTTTITGTGGTTVKGGTNSGTLNLNDGNAPGGTNITISGSGGGTTATVFQTTTDAKTTTVNTVIGTSNVYSGGSTATLQAGPTNSVTVNSGNAGSTPGVSINGVVGTGSSSMTGVLITGSGQNGASYTNGDRAAGTIPNWADVAIQSKSYGLGDPTLGSAILVTDYGVQILSPQPISGQQITNNTGINNSTGIIVNNNGSNTSSGSVENNNGMNSGSGNVVNNSGGTSGGGSSTNNIGMNTSTTGGAATNNIGGISGNGTVTNGFGNNTSNTGAIANNSIGMSSGNGETNNSFGGSSGTGNTTNLIGENNGTGVMTNSFGGGSGATANNIGNTNPGTTINSTAGNSTMNMSNGAISMVGDTTAGLATNGTTGTTSAIGSGGLAVYGTARTIAPNTTINNQLAGKQYQNKINGNLFVDGNVYINGTLDYVASDSATTSVVGGGVSTSILSGARQAVSGSTGIVLKGTNTPHVVVDGNGKLLTTTGVASQSSAAMVLTNGYGNTHGIIVNESQTTISGGTRSSSLTLNDAGARFSNSANGSPITVTGVADGRSDFDAVNFRQLRNIVASGAAMANLPGVDPNKTFSMGLGLGHYEGETAFALGMGYRPSNDSMVRASISSGTSGYSKPTIGMGASLSW